MGSRRQKFQQGFDQVEFLGGLAHPAAHERVHAGTSTRLRDHTPTGAFRRFEKYVPCPLRVRRLGHTAPGS